MIICLVGPSGSGKTAICEKMLEMYPMDFAKVKTATTRKKRDSEPDSAYYFFTEEEFAEKNSQNYFLETSEYAGCFYGTPISSIENIQNAGKTALVPIDINGAMRYKAYFGDEVKICFVWRSKTAIIQSIVERNIPTDEKAKRICQIDKEYELMNLCDRCVVNNQTLEDSARVVKGFAN